MTSSTRNRPPRSGLVQLSISRNSLNSDLGRIRGNDLRNAFEFRYLAGHTDALSSVILLRVSEFGAFSPPDHNLKDLLGIWFVEIYENRIFLASSHIDAS